jgi:O-Antigen ligase
LSSAALEPGVQTSPPVARAASGRVALLATVLAPSAFLIAGALVGYAFTLDERVALERLVGLVAAAVVSAAAALGLQRVGRPEPVLIATAITALLGGLWIIAATDPTLQAVLRGPIGNLLGLVVRPLVGSVRLGEAVEITNTRFIVGYNGLADLCLVAIFSSGAVLLARPRRGSGALVLALVALGLVLLAATGSRGALTGLAVGACAVGLVALRWRYAVLMLVAAPLVILVATLGVLDKGLEFSSTSGRVQYWNDLLRLLLEYPLTGVGLGVNTANQLAVAYEINPDPERIAYAHNTFVQSYLEQGPLGLIGALLPPLLVIAAIVVARRDAANVRPWQRPLLVAGVGVVASLEAHGLTDQVLTTNVGGALVLLGLAATLAALAPAGLVLIGGWLARGLAVLGVATLITAALLVMLPGGRAQALLNIGSLQLNRALALPAQAPVRSAELIRAEETLEGAREQAPDHPALLRQLARVRSARFDDSGALDALRQASASPRLDAFDMLQIAHLHRDLGLAEQAYAWAARAYATWGREPDDQVLQVYAQDTLADDAGGHRAQTLAEQAEAAMRARAFGQAVVLFQQALTFAPSNVYLQDRLGGAQRGVERYGPGETIQLD